MPKLEDFIDKRFVTTAIVLCVVYAAIVTFLKVIFGSTVSGIFGIALTAIFAKLFTQFEKLKFNEVPERIVIDHGLNFWRILLVALFFTSLQLFVMDIIDDILYKFAPSVPYFQGEDYGNNVAVIRGRVILHYGIWEIALISFSYFIGGCIIGKAIPIVNYSSLFISVILGSFLDFFKENLFSVVLGINKPYELKYAFDDYENYLLYIIFGLIGFYLTKSITSNSPRRAYSGL